MTTDPQLLSYSKEVIKKIPHKFVNTQYKFGDTQVELWKVKKYLTKEPYWLTFKFKKENK